MIRTRLPVVILSTVPSPTVGRTIADAILVQRLAACVSLIPGVESHYWWKNRIQKGHELQLVIKTIQSNCDAIEEVILKIHPYDTPEIMVLPVKGGNRRFMDWWKRMGR